MKTVKIAILLLFGVPNCISQDVDKTIDSLIGAVEFKADEQKALLALDKDATFRILERLRMESEPISESGLFLLLAKKYVQFKAELSGPEELQIIELLGRGKWGRCANLDSLSLRTMPGVIGHPLKAVRGEALYVIPMPDMSWRGVWP